VFVFEFVFVCVCGVAVCCVVLSYGVLCCVVLCCVVLCCVVLCCVVLCCVVSCRVVSCRVVSCRVVLCCTAVFGVVVLCLVFVAVVVVVFLGVVACVAWRRGASAAQSKSGSKSFDTFRCQSIFASGKTSTVKLLMFASEGTWREAWRVVTWSLRWRYMGQWPPVDCYGRPRTVGSK